MFTYAYITPITLQAVLPAGSEVVALEIRELRVGELAQAVEFSAACQQACEAADIDVPLSLAACEDGQMIGVMLCIGRQEDQRRMQLLIDEAHLQDKSLLHQLMDKSLLKLRSHGVCRARIEPAPSLDAASFWTVVNWTPA